jgi:hypothetical protein
MTRKVNHGQLENPTGEVTGGADVHRLDEVGAFSNAAEGDATPEKKDRCGNDGDGGEEGEKAKWIG